MQQVLPIKFGELFKLTSLGLSPDIFKPGVLSFESDKHICIKETNPVTFWFWKSELISCLGWLYAI